MKSQFIIAVSTILSLAATPTAALDLTAISDRLLDCDGPGIVLAEHMAMEQGSPQSEAEGYAVLELVDMIVHPDGAPEGRSLPEVARQHLDAVSVPATERAIALIEKCGSDTGAPSAPTTGTIDNPFAAR